MEIIAKKTHLTDLKSPLRLAGDFQWCPYVQQFPGTVHDEDVRLLSGNIDVDRSGPDLVGASDLPILAVDADG